MAVIIIVLVLAACVWFIATYRAEGLVALYIMGPPLLFIAVEKLGLVWSTEATGGCLALLVLPILLWWQLAPKNPEEQLVPRKFDIVAVIFLALPLVWEIKSLMEGITIRKESIYEYYKWAYVIAFWAVPLIIGMAFPLSLKRLRRLLAACGVVGFAVAVIVLFSYATGERDFSEWGDRYTPADRLSGLTIGVDCGFGIAALMGYALLRNLEKKNTLAYVMAAAASSVALLAILLTGSRGPLLATAACVIVMLLLSGARAAVQTGFATLIAGAMLFFTWQLIPAVTLERMFGTVQSGGGLAGGAQLRWELARSAFDILDRAPVFGQTIGLSSVIGIPYCHNFTLQFMVEFGLLGFGLYMVAFLIMAARWGRAAIRRTPLKIIAAPLMVFYFGIFVERHASGPLTCPEIWLLMGIMAGHRLEQAVSPADEEQSLPKYELAASTAELIPEKA